MVKREERKKFAPPPLESGMCGYNEWCRTPGPGCTSSAMGSCDVAKEMNYFEREYSCPSSPGSHCDIPAYRMIMKKDTPCGELGKCLVVEALKGAIPPQFFSCTGMMPKNYKRPPLKIGALKRVLNECSML